MARVASCPQCDHQLVIPSEATGEAWAKCPECRAFFQVAQASTRELPTAVLVEADDDELAASAAVTDELGLEPETEFALDETVSNAAAKNVGDDSQSPIDDLDLQLDDVDVVEKPKSGDDLEAAAQRIDEWFRSAKTVPDTPPVGDEASSASDEQRLDVEADETIDLDMSNNADDKINEPSLPLRANATIDMNADDMDELVGMADFDIDEPADELIKSESTNLADEPASWDDSERMEDLLGDIEVPSNEEFVAAVSRNDEQMELEAPADVEERPPINMFADEAPQVTATAGRPSRKRSPVRSLALVAIAGFLGAAAGYYALLWMRGPSMDFLNVANYLPAAALPPSFSQPKQVAQVSPPIVPETSAETDTTTEQTTDSTEPQDLAADEAAEPMPGETAATDTDAALAEGAEQPAEAQADFVEGETPDGGVEQASAVGDRYAKGTDTSPTTEGTPEASTPTDVTAEKPVDDLTVADLDASSPAEEATSPETATAESTEASPTIPEESATETATTEPAAIDPLFDESAPAATAETIEAIQISGAPTFTAEELSSAVAAAKSAQLQLIEGNFADGKEVKRAKGGAFAILADLAQKSLFADGGQDELPLAKDSDELFRSTLADAHTRGEIAQIVPMWIASANRKHGGVFFGGKVTSHETTGSVVECKVELENGDTLTVLAPASDAAAIDPSKPVGIVGWILENPAQQVGGYTGAATEAIWTKKLIPLE